jgi:hypothetical protein
MRKIERASRKSKAIKTENTIIHAKKALDEKKKKDEKNLPTLKRKLEKLEKKKRLELTPEESYTVKQEISIIRVKIRNINIEKNNEDDNDKSASNSSEIVETETTTTINSCEVCGNDELIHDTKVSQLICEICGSSQYYLDDDTPQWSDEVQVSTPFKYTRINNFRVHLQRLQGVEAKIIPEQIIEDIQKELRARRKTSGIDHMLIKKVLKHLGHTKYYNNISTILSKITNQKPPILSQEFSEELERDFLQIEKSFERHKDKFQGPRRHFFSYNFVMNKLFRKMQLKYPNDENIPKLIPMFPLLKSRQKLQEQDSVWRYICADLSIVYQRSV